MAEEHSEGPSLETVYSFIVMLALSSRVVQS